MVASDIAATTVTVNNSNDVLQKKYSARNKGIRTPRATDTLEMQNEMPVYIEENYLLLLLVQQRDRSLPDLAMAAVAADNASTVNSYLCEQYLFKEYCKKFLINEYFGTLYNTTLLQKWK